MKLLLVDMSIQAYSGQNMAIHTSQSHNPLSPAIGTNEKENTGEIKAYLKHH